MMFPHNTNHNKTAHTLIPIMTAHPPVPTHVSSLPPSTVLEVCQVSLFVSLFCFRLCLFKHFQISFFFVTVDLACFMSQKKCVLERESSCGHVCMHIGICSCFCFICFLYFYIYNVKVNLHFLHQSTFFLNLYENLFA